MRAVNYHGTPESSRESFARQCEYYARHFRALSEDELARFLAGDLPLDRVGLLLTFDDGLRSNYRVAARTLDEFGLKAVFLVPVGFIETATQAREAQRAFYGRITSWPLRDEEPAETFEPMSWDDLADLLARGHAVGSHTVSHLPLGGAVPREVLEREIVDSKRIMERRLGREVRSFCWPIGRLSDYSVAAQALVRAHYQLGFTTFAGPVRRGGNRYAIHRSNVESYMGLARVKAATQGLAELYFRRRRRRFEQLLARGEVSH